MFFQLISCPPGVKRDTEFVYRIIGNRIILPEHFVAIGEVVIGVNLSQVGRRQPDIDVTGEHSHVVRPLLHTFGLALSSPGVMWIYGDVEALSFG